MSFGSNFLSHDGKVHTAETLKQAKVVGVYFSAHWCPPCRGFTPVLAEFYREVQKSNPGALEIVFATFDQDKSQFEEYFKEMPWISLPFKDPKIEELSDKYEVNGIPSLLLFKPDGTLIEADGRTGVEEEGPAILKTWIAAASN